VEEKKEHPYIEEDEIDLYELFLVVRKRLRLIMGLFMAAVVVAAVVSFLMPPVYSASFIIRMPGLSVKSAEPVISTTEAEKLVQELDGLRQEGRSRELAQRLGVDSAAVDGLVEIQAKTPRRQKKFIEITVDVYEPSLIKDISSGILKHLNSNRYANERISLQRESLTHLKNEIEARISETEALKKAVVSQIKRDRIKDLGFNPIGLDKAIIDLRQKLKEVETEIKLLKGFEFAVEPVVPQNPAKPKKKLIVAVSGITALFLGIFLAFFMEWLDKNRKKDHRES